MTDDIPHGTRSSYVNLGCRCADCLAAHMAYMRSEIARLRQSRAELIPHGTRNGYDAYGCRCDRCRKANAAYQREYRARRQ